jgi:hypothetical protein
LTSYDEFFTQFITISQTDNFNIPNDIEKQYDLIHTAVRKFNSKLKDNLVCDDLMEEVNRDLDDEKILIIAHYLRLTFLENQLIYYVTLWKPFAKELGQVTYKTQVDSLKELIKNEKEEIEELTISGTTNYSEG